MRTQEHRAQGHGRLLAAAAAAMLVSAAQAQGTPAGAAQAVDEGLRRQAERERHLQQAEAPQASSLRPAVRAALLPELPDEQPCFVIHEVVLLGPGAGRFGWLGNAWYTYIEPVAVWFEG